MSLLAVGLNHRTASVDLLERVAVGTADVPAVRAELCASPLVAEAVVLSTCNRVEIYVDVDRFHAGVHEVTDLLASRSGVALDELSEHLYVCYEDLAVQHLFTVACGLDSMVIGEGQILGQLRASYDRARLDGTAGRLMHELFQTALRVGKRAHTDTGIDGTGRSLVTVALDAAAAAVGPLDGRPALVVGAGSMSGLAAATLLRTGVSSITVANRSPANAERLAATVGGRPIGLESLETEVARADVVVTCTGAVGTLLDPELVRRALAARAGRPLALVDLALPRDIDPAVRNLSGIHLIDLEALRGVLQSGEAGAEVVAAEAIVTEEVAAFLADQRSTRVAPTVVALRARAAEVVDAELGRLAARLPDLPPRDRLVVETSLRRVVDKLLHTPTVRVKELAAAPGGDAYAEALRELFGLDRVAPAAVAALGAESSAP